jgi:Holliday junction DNA helicase RuvA subunit
MFFLFRYPLPRPATTTTIVLMIAILRGILLEKHPNQAIVETGGVGYDVTIPVSTFTRLPEAGKEVRLRIHTHVREDALALYGFLTQDEKALFEKLIGVSGIGPTLAVKILSGLAAPDLINFIRRGEVDRLVRIPGVGKKTAERMVLELRGAGNARRSRALARRSGCALGAVEPGLRTFAGRGRGAQGQGGGSGGGVRTALPARFGTGTLARARSGVSW